MSRSETTPDASSWITLNLKGGNMSAYMIRSHMRSGEARGAKRWVAVAIVMLAALLAVALGAH